MGNATKTNALQALLGSNINVTRDVPIKRLGVNFTVKALTDDGLSQARLECTFGNHVDESKLAATVIARSCVEPNFNDRSLIDHYGAEDGADCVKKALLAGESVKLYTAILEISGFGEDDIDFPNS